MSDISTFHAQRVNGTEWWKGRLPYDGIKILLVFEVQKGWETASTLFYKGYNNCSNIPEQFWGKSEDNVKQLLVETYWIGSFPFPTVRI